MTTTDNSTTAARAGAEDWKYAEKAMTWYGWGSPVGVGLFLLCVAGVAALLRYAFLG